MGPARAAARALRSADQFAADPIEDLAENRHTLVELFQYPLRDGQLTCLAHRSRGRSAQSRRKQRRDYSEPSAPRNYSLRTETRRKRAGPPQPPVDCVQV